jgi:hypothetical protein
VNENRLLRPVSFSLAPLLRSELRLIWRSSRLSIHGRTFVALLDPAIEEGIAGFGTASRQRYVPLICNTCALSGRLSIGISDVESGRESFSKIGGAIASKSTSTMKDEFHRRMM